jgi:hypothetical protein
MFIPAGSKHFIVRKPCASLHRGTGGQKHKFVCSADDQRKNGRESPAASLPLLRHAFQTANRFVTSLDACLYLGRRAGNLTSNWSRR